MAIGLSFRQHCLRRGRKFRLAVLQFKFIGFIFISRVFEEKFLRPANRTFHVVSPFSSLKVFKLVPVPKNHMLYSYFSSSWSISRSTKNNNDSRSK
jgi:hypothetical protein